MGFFKEPIKYNHKLRKATLTIKNAWGEEKTEWIFRLLNDSEAELEPREDTGEPTLEQAFEQHIIDNSISMIEPRTGSLKLWEQKDVNVYYVSEEVEFLHLKVILYISHGKPIKTTIVQNSKKN